MDSRCWAFTDVYGDIHTMSREARELFGIADSGRRENLLKLFPQYGKALVFDIEVALTGWPTGRTLLLQPLAAQPIPIRYQVSCRAGTEKLQLFWQLYLEQPSTAPRCA